MGEDRAREFFLRIYGTLPRAGQGGDEHTQRAVESLPDALRARVLDLGCGPGTQTLALAHALPDAEILAVDLLPSMVEEARRRLDVAGLSARAEVVCADMASPPVEPGSQDLIWSEGAIYNLGVTEALETWQPLLSPHGVVAFTEPVWLVAEPPEEIVAWWTAEYPPISDEAGVRKRIAQAGYHTLDTFVLPESAWWDEYYEPMSARIDDLRREHPDDEVADSVASMAEHEIDMCRRFGATYSYVFFIVAPE